MLVSTAFTTPDSSKAWLFMKLEPVPVETGRE